MSGSSQKQIREVVVHPIDKIEVYEVREDELRRIEEHVSHVGEDLTFALAYGSSCITFLLTLLTANVSHPLISKGLMVSAVVFGVLFALRWTKWWRSRRQPAEALATIRARSIEVLPNLEDDESPLQLTLHDNQTHPLNGENNKRRPYSTVAARPPTSNSKLS
jgi:hypothetical protein